MPRHRVPDTEFGSDSFLDIVANVVGILIILIVVAGVRVSRAPVVLSTAAASGATSLPTAREASPSVSVDAAPAESAPPAEPEVVHWPADPVEPPPPPPRPVAPR
jgi:hypothetical protein